MELKPSELFAEWKAGRFRPVYLLIGEESWARQEALSAIKAAFKADDFNFREFSEDISEDSARAIVSEAMTLPVFADRRLVLVRSARWTAAARELLAEYLKEALASSTVILVSDEKKADPKDILVKAAGAAGAICVFSPLKEDEARQRLQELAKGAGKRLAAEAASVLIGEVGSDWGLLRQELEKALLFAGPEPAISVEHVWACLGYQKAADPFALSRLIQSRQLKPCMAQLRRQLLEGKADEQAFRALSQLSSAVSRQLRAKRMLKTGGDAPTIFRALRLHPYWDRDYLQTLSRLSEPALIRDLKACLETEVSLKSRSWLDPKIELERLVASICER
ncbi:MAG: DNA polymerase III subunit delta [Elusimicrobia bacterium]|nr:DNA polymerase III subunit delta [Elusimicrobiota bacterium]